MAGITECCIPEIADVLETFYVVPDSSRVDSICFFSGIRPLSAPLFFLRDSCYLCDLVHLSLFFYYLVLWVEFKCYIPFERMKSCNNGPVDRPTVFLTWGLLFSLSDHAEACNSHMFALCPVHTRQHIFESATYFFPDSKASISTRISIQIEFVRPHVSDTYPDAL